MRQKRAAQISIFDQFAEHELGQQLKSISGWIDENPEFVDIVANDLIGDELQATGCIGYSAESVLRFALLKQIRELSYNELAFYLEDSQTFNSFARLGCKSSPSKSSLQGLVSQISDESWQQINRQIITKAQVIGIEKGRQVRVDSSVTETHIHAPTDSSLLADSVRVMIRLLEKCRSLQGKKISFSDHQRSVKKYTWEIQYSRGQEKKRKLYQKLLKQVNKTRGYMLNAYSLMSGVEDDISQGWCEEARHYEALIDKVVSQTERRVLKGEKVPVEDKVVSLFEEHTDIIRKGGRDTLYGHKWHLVTGQSGLVTDLYMPRGNSSDMASLIPIVDRHKELFGKVPRQLAADGCYASQSNLSEAKAAGVKDVAFQKKKGLTIEKMAKSRWVYKKLINFRAGVEANIGNLKDNFGLRRCNWKGWEKFKAYIWSSVVAYNLTLVARLQA